jgi:hypothetical protein
LLATAQIQYHLIARTHYGHLWNTGIQLEKQEKRNARNAETCTRVFSKCLSMLCWNFKGFLSFRSKHLKAFSDDKNEGHLNMKIQKKTVVTEVQNRGLDSARIVVWLEYRKILANL